MAVADPEEVDLRQALNVWLEDVGILIDLVRVVGVIADPCGKCKLPDTVLAFFEGRLLRWLVALGFLLLVSFQLRGRIAGRARAT